jgi:tRNA threonylcarbamoyl adenosine modification protein YeaZ
MTLSPPVNPRKCYTPLPMKTLLLETSTEKSFIAVIHGEKEVLKPLEGGPLLSKKLALEVANLLKDQEMKPDQIGVGIGPGSLTGVRVGLSLARSLSFGWNIPCFEFCSMKTFVPEEKGPFAVLVDARSQGIHFILGDKKSESIQWGEPLLLKHEELIDVLAEIPNLLSPHPHLIELKLKRPCQLALPSYTEVLPRK